MSVLRQGCMSAFEAYQLYLSLKAHFTRSSYDHLKNHPRNATLKAVWCETYAGNGPVDTTGTLTWLRSSRFGKASQTDEGAFKLLRFTAEEGPALYKVGQTFRSGSPAGDGELKLTQEERRSIRKRGQDPEKVIAGAPARNYTEFKELTAKEEK